jgi:hypothetical protein
MGYPGRNGRTSPIMAFLTHRLHIEWEKNMTRTGFGQGFQRVDNSSDKDTVGYQGEGLFMETRFQTIEDLFYRKIMLYQELVEPFGRSPTEKILFYRASRPSAKSCSLHCRKHPSDMRWMVHPFH